MAVSAPIVPRRRIGAVEPLGHVARRVARRAQGEVMEAGVDLVTLKEHLQVAALADAQGDPIRARIWRLLIAATGAARREGASETYALLVEVTALAPRYERCEQIEDERREVMRAYLTQARRHVRTGTGLLDLLLTTRSPN